MSVRGVLGRTGPAPSWNADREHLSTNLRNVFAIDKHVFLLIKPRELVRTDRWKMRIDLYLVEQWNVVYGVIYIVNAGADNVTRDCDYRAALYRALNATPACVMFTQWLASYSENTYTNAEKNFRVLHDKRVFLVFRCGYRSHISELQ